MTRLCTIEGCSNKHLARGYCNKHLIRFKKYGDPLITVKRNFKGLSIEERFMKFIDKSENGCWIWNGHLSEKGYGKFNIKSKQRIAHRVSYELFNGELKEGFFVCHQCDNPSCVNPEHLFLGTPENNVQDMLNKNRQAKGEKIARSKLTWNDVQEIRRLWNTGKYLYVDLARKFDYSAQNITKIIQNEIWVEEEVK